MSEQHCPGEPTVSPWRLSGHGTVYAVVVCCCGEQMTYQEIEPQARVGEKGSE